MNTEEEWVSKTPTNKKEAGLDVLIDWLDFGVDLVQFITDAVLWLF